MNLIVHKDNDITYIYLVNNAGKVEANVAVSIPPDMNEDEIIEMQKIKLFRYLQVNTKVFNGDSKEYKEFLIGLKKDELEEDFKYVPKS